MKFLLSFIVLNFVFYLPLTFVIGFHLGGIFLLLPFFVMYAFSPLADFFMAHYAGKWNKMNVFKFTHSKIVLASLKLYPFIQFALLLSSLSFVSTLSLEDSQFWMMAFSFGLVSGGTGLLVAHELMHRKDSSSLFGNYLLTLCNFYTHWRVEHVWGHHKNVATPLDPCFAMRGTGLYRFIPRSILGQLKSSFILRPKMFVVGKLVEIIFFASVFSLLGINAVVFLLFQALVGVCLLEQLNYIEHYGLVRRQSKKGVYEKVGPEHSWETQSLLSNMSIVNLGLHSDHHAHINRPFNELRALESEAVMKYGIPIQMWASMLPPLWFSWIDPKLKTMKG